MSPARRDGSGGGGASAARVSACSAGGQAPECWVSRSSKVRKRVALAEAVVSASAGGTAWRARLRRDPRPGHLPPGSTPRDDASARITCTISNDETLDRFESVNSPTSPAPNAPPSGYGSTCRQARQPSRGRRRRCWSAKVEHKTGVDMAGEDLGHGIVHVVQSPELAHDRGAAGRVQLEGLDKVDAGSDK